MSSGMNNWKQQQPEGILRLLLFPIESSLDKMDQHND